MKKILLILMVMAGMANATTIAYVVGNTADTTQTSLQYDRQWVRFLANNMGYTVVVMTDNTADTITNTNAYDGYFISATADTNDLTNISTATKGVVICDNNKYDDFLVASGKVETINMYNSAVQGQEVSAVDSTHWITKQMSDTIWMAYTGASYGVAYTGIPTDAIILFKPTNKYWDATVGSPDSAWCYAFDTNDTLTSGLATGRRVVALSHYNLLSSVTDLGWCHPYEWMGNMCAWAWSDTTNVYVTDYNCYSTDRASTPEVYQSWCEYGDASTITSSGNRVYANGRIGDDAGYIGVGFLNFKNYLDKVSPNKEVDSLVWTYRINYGGYGIDANPYYYDTITVTANGTSTMTIDSTTLDHAIDYYTYRFNGGGRGILIRTGVGADTTQKGDTIQTTTISSSQKCNVLPFTKGWPATPPATRTTWWNGDSTSPSYQVALRVADRYSGFGFWLKLYKILPQNSWVAPRVSRGEGGNPYPPGTKAYANRTFIVSGQDSVRWSGVNLVAGVDYDSEAIDSFLFNANTFPPTGTATVRFNIPGSVFDDPLFNGLVFKTIDTTGSNGSDSFDVEIIPQSLNSTRESQYNVQKFEMYLSDAIPLTIGVDDTTITVTSDVGGTIDLFANYVRNTGDGVMVIDSIRDDASWLTQIAGGSGGVTPLLVTHGASSSGTAGSDTATVTVYASTADNTPLTYSVIRVLTGTGTVIESSVDSIVFSGTVGSDISPQGVTISNLSGEALECLSVSDDATWLLTEPSGTNTPFVIQHSLSQVEVGYRYANVTVGCSGADNTPLVYRVVSNITPVVTRTAGGAVIIK